MDDPFGEERPGPAQGALLSTAQFDLISIPLEAGVAKMRAHGVPDQHIQRFLSYFQARMLPATSSDSGGGAAIRGRERGSTSRRVNPRVVRHRDPGE